MRAYAVECDGKISHEAYITLDSAKKFLKSRVIGRDAKLSSNGWLAEYKNDKENHIIKILELDVKG